MSLDSAATDPHLSSLTVHGDTSSFPTHAEVVRTMLEVGRFATLTTITAGGRSEPGFPFGSLVAYSTLSDGSPLVCISDLAEHTRNLRNDPRAGMLLTDLPVDPSADPLDHPRASLIGRLEPYTPSDDERSVHIDRHRGVLAYVDFPDFGWWRLSIASARYVGGFGHMSWVTGAAISKVEPDDVLAESQAAVDHMNVDHAAANLDMVRWIAGLADATAARVHSIDRRGLTLYAEMPSGSLVVSARIPFLDGPLSSPEGVRPAVVALARRARELAGAQG